MHNEKYKTRNLIIRWFPVIILTIALSGFFIFKGVVDKKLNFTVAFIYLTFSIVYNLIVIIFSKRLMFNTRELKELHVGQIFSVIIWILFLIIGYNKL